MKEQEYKPSPIKTILILTGLLASLSALGFLFAQLNSEAYETQYSLWQIQHVQATEQVVLAQQAVEAQMLQSLLTSNPAAAKAYEAQQAAASANEGTFIARSTEIAAVATYEAFVPIATGRAWAAATQQVQAFAIATATMKAAKAELATVEFNVQASEKLLKGTQAMGLDTSTALATLETLRKQAQNKVESLEKAEAFAMTMPWFAYEDPPLLLVPNDNEIANLGMLPFQWYWDRRSNPLACFVLLISNKGEGPYLPASACTFDTGLLLDIRSLCYVRPSMSGEYFWTVSVNQQWWTGEWITAAPTSEPRKFRILSIPMPSPVAGLPPVQPPAPCYSFSYDTHFTEPPETRVAPTLTISPTTQSPGPNSVLPTAGIPSPQGLTYTLLATPLPFSDEAEDSINSGPVTEFSISQTPGNRQDLSKQHSWERANPQDFTYVMPNPEPGLTRDAFFFVSVLIAGVATGILLEKLFPIVRFWITGIREKL